MYFIVETFYSQHVVIYRRPSLLKLLFYFAFLALARKPVRSQRSLQNNKSATFTYRVPCPVSQIATAGIYLQYVYVAAGMCNRPYYKTPSCITMLLIDVQPDFNESK